MNPERYQQVCEIFLAARSKPPADRAVFLDATCKDDASLRGEVESLLTNDNAATNFLDNPVLGDDFLNQVPPARDPSGRNPDMNRTGRSRVGGEQFRASAGDTTPAENARTGGRRHAIFSAVSAVLLFALIFVGWIAIRATRQRDDAVMACRLAEQREAAATSAAAASSREAANAALSANDVAAARRHLEAVPESHRDATWRAIVARTNESLATLAEHDGDVLCVAFSPDGRMLASAATDGTLRLWDTETHRLLRTMLVVKAAFAGLAFSPDSELLAAGTHGGSLSVWNVADGEMLVSWAAHEKAIRCVAFSPDAMSIASASDDKTARLWDVAANVQIARLDHPAGVSCVVFDLSSARLATGCRDNVARVWQLDGDGPRTILEFDLVAGGVDNNSRPPVAFSPDGATLAAGSDAGLVTVWNVRTGERLRTMVGHSGRVGCVAFSPDATQLASGSSDTTLRLWNANTGAMLQTLHAHTGELTRVAFSPSGDTLATSSNDKTIRLWNSKPDAAQPTRGSKQ